MRTTGSAIAVAMASLMPGVALATPVTTVAGSIGLNGNSPTTYTNADASPYGWGGSTGADLYANVSSTPSNGFIHAYSFDNGVLGTRSSGSGTYGVSAPISLVNSYTAPGTTDHLLGTFHFDSISVEANANAINAVSAAASWGFSIKRDGNLYASLLISANASHDGDAGNDLVSITSSGFDLAQLGLGSVNAYNNYAGIFGSGGYVTIDLGAIGAGNGFSLEYLMNSSADGFSTADPGNCGGGYGYGYGNGYGNGLPPRDGGSGGGACGGANSIGRSGDPFNFSGGYNPEVYFSGNPTEVDAEFEVPEPATLGVLAFGLAGMGLARRRRR